MLDYASVLALRLTGLSYRKIGAQIGVSGQRIQQFLSPEPEVKDVVIARAGGRCETCQVPAGATGHIHHRAARGATPETYNADGNLMLLCNSCHQKAHGDPVIAERRRRRTPEEKHVRYINRGYYLGARALGIAVEEYAGHRESGERWCSGHQAWEPEARFPTRSRKGKQQLAGRCRDANREQSRRYARRVTTDGRHSYERTVASLKQGATRLGIPLSEYIAHTNAGQKWCSGHRQWESRSAFGSNVRTADGLNSSCRVWERGRYLKHRSTATLEVPA